MLKNEGQRAEISFDTCWWTQRKHALGCLKTPSNRVSVKKWGKFVLFFVNNRPHLLLIMHMKILIYYIFFDILVVICYCTFQAKKEKGVTGSLTKIVVWTGVSGQERRVFPSDSLWMLLAGLSDSAKIIKKEESFRSWHYLTLQTVMVYFLKTFKAETLLRDHKL